MRAQLVWTPQFDGSAWLVIHFYPGRHEPAVPPFFMLSLQKKLLQSEMMPRRCLGRKAIELNYPDSTRRISSNSPGP